LCVRFDCKTYCSFAFLLLLHCSVLFEDPYKSMYQLLRIFFRAFCIFEVHLYLLSCLWIWKRNNKHRKINLFLNSKSNNAHFILVFFLQFCFSDYKSLIENIIVKTLFICFIVFLFNFIYSCFFVFGFILLDVIHVENQKHCYDLLWETYFLCCKHQAYYKEKEHNYLSTISLELIWDY